jgi:hypothetical protein
VEILHSLEVRWFLDDAETRVPGIRARFDASTLLSGRVDRYLFTERDDLGFKVRAEANRPIKVETKYRTEALGEFRLAPNVDGKVERWTKLSLALDDPEIAREGKWLALEKSRRLRKFAFEQDAVSEVQVQEQVACGCGAELTELQFRRGDAAIALWTLGFEASGPPDLLFAALRATCEAIFAGSAGSVSHELRIEWSRGYPSWLADVPADAWTSEGRPPPPPPPAAP